MRSHWLRMALPALLALALSLAAVSTASASGSHADSAVVNGVTVPADDEDGDTEDVDSDDGDTDDGDTDDVDTEDVDSNDGVTRSERFVDVDAILGLCDSGDHDSKSLGFLCGLFTFAKHLMPPQAQQGLATAIAAHADHVAPGLVQRFANSASRDGGKLLRGLNHDGESSNGPGSDPIAVCRRLANSDELSEHPELAERCRTLLDDGVTSPVELCRRLAESGSVEDHEQLAKRCRNLVDGHDGSGDDSIAVCRRLANSDELSEHPALAERCRNLVNDDGDTDARPRLSSDRQGLEKPKQRPKFRPALTELAPGFSVVEAASATTDVIQ